ILQGAFTSLLSRPPLRMFECRAVKGMTAGKGGVYMGIFDKQALAEKHLLITGATGGIGWETAKAVAQMGAKLTVTGRDADKLKQLEKELKGMMDGRRLHVHAADLT